MIKASNDKIIMTIKEKKKIFLFNEIIHIDEGNYFQTAIIYTVHSIVIMPYFTHEIEKELDGRFCRCNKNRIVNMQYVTNIDIENRLLMFEDKICLVSEEYLEPIMNKFIATRKELQVINDSINWPVTE